MTEIYIDNMNKSFDFLYWYCFNK